MHDSFARFAVAAERQLSCWPAMRCQGCNTVGGLAWRVIRNVRRCPLPGLNRTVARRIGRNVLVHSSSFLLRAHRSSPLATEKRACELQNRGAALPMTDGR